MSTFSVVATLTLSTTHTLVSNSLAYTRIRCCSDSNRKRGFGPQQDNKDANKVSGGGSLSRGRKSTSQSGTTSKREPWLSSKSNSIQSNVSQDVQFEERLEAIKRIS